MSGVAPLRPATSSYALSVPERLVFRRHALERMAQRRVTVDDVRRILDSGAVIREYPDDRPFPSRLTLGWLGERPVHVVSAVDAIDATTIIITVYEPDRTVWDETFRRKR